MRLSTNYLFIIYYTKLTKRLPFQHRNIAAVLNMVKCL